MLPISQYAPNSLQAENSHLALPFVSLTPDLSPVSLLPLTESLSAVLSDLQALSTAILDEEKGEEKPNEDGGNSTDTWELLTEGEFLKGEGDESNGIGSE